MNVDTINFGSEWWIHFMAYRILDSTLVFALVGTVWLLARQRVSAQFGYLLFLLILAKLIVPSWFSIPELISSYFPGKELAGSNLSIGWLDWNFGTGSPGGYDAATNADNANPNRNMDLDSDSALTLPSVLMFVWFAIVTVFTIRMAVIIRNSCRMIQNSKRIADRQRLIALQQLQEIAGIKRPVKWVHGDWVKTPVAFGIVHPAIAIPANLFEKFSSNQIRWILLHELAHIKRGDAIVAYIQQIVQILFFMHPVVWWANIIIDQQREYACDDAALAGSQSSPVECGEGFLGVVMQSNGLPAFLPATLGLINYKTMIRRRLMRILDEKHITNFNLSRRESLLLLASTPAILLMGGKTATAQVGEWVKVLDTGPSPRISPRMAFDSARGKVVMFGGFENSNASVVPPNHTWEFDGTEWTRVATTGPKALVHHSMVYDAARKKVVLFGGSDAGANNYFGDTWEWDGTEWTQVSNTGPEPRVLFGMAYDSTRERVVLFGGFNHQINRRYGDTWVWDGIEWTLISEEGPEPRTAWMVYDSIRDRIVLYGGNPDNGIALDDTWEWDGARWTEVTMSVGPGPRTYHMMAFDIARRKTVLFGGVQQPMGITPILADTWEWDGNEWSELPITGPGIGAADMVYDSIREKIVLFGGATGQVPEFRENTPIGDTWELGAPSSGLPFSFWSNY